MSRLSVAVSWLPGKTSLQFNGFGLAVLACILCLNWLCVPVSAQNRVTILEAVITVETRHAVELAANKKADKETRNAGFLATTREPEVAANSAKIDTKRLAFAREQDMRRRLSLEGRQLNKEGDAAMNRGDLDAALRLYSQALEARVAGGDEAGAAVTRNNLGAVYAEKGNHAEAIKWYEQALAFHVATNNYAEQSVTLHNIGLSFSDLRQLDNAIAYYGKAMQMAYSVNDRPQQATVLNSLGSAYDAKGDKQKALANFQESLNILLQLRQTTLTAVIYGNLGKTYMDLKDDVRAIQHYEQAIQLSMQVNDALTYITALNNFGQLKLKVKEYDFALRCFNEAQQQSAKRGYNSGLATAFHNLGMYYAVKDDKPQAQQYYEQALSIFRNINDPEGERVTLQRLAALQQAPQAMKPAPVAKEAPSKKGKRTRK